MPGSWVGSDANFSKRVSTSNQVAVLTHLVPGSRTSSGWLEDLAPEVVPHGLVSIHRPYRWGEHVVIAATPTIPSLIRICSDRDDATGTGASAG